MRQQTRIEPTRGAAGRRRPPRAGLIAILACCLLASPTAAEDRPALLQAREIAYDQNIEVFTARGDVEISRGERILLADAVTYDRVTDTVVARGNVTLLEPDGSVVFADHTVLRNELRTGFIENLRMRLNDGSRLAANRAERSSDGRKLMQQAVYSPCRSCSEQPPLWQIRSDRVIHDESRQDIIYHDAYLEFLGIPALYTPFLVHPDPQVEMRTGFLPPRFGFSENLGYLYGQPFFWAIRPDRVLEIEPIIHSREGLIVRSHYKQAYNNGHLDLVATAGLFNRAAWSFDSPVADRAGSVDLEGRFDLNDIWRTGFNLAHSSRRTYLRQFDLSDADFLTSQLFLEGFHGRSYSHVAGYGFQGLGSTIDKKAQALALPTALYSFVGEPDFIGGRTRIDTTLSLLNRQRGADTRKLAVVGDWKRPWFGPFGDLYTLSLRLQADAHHASDVPVPGMTLTEAFSEARLYPQVGLNWRLPLVRTDEATQQLVEPVINLVAGPNDGNPDEILNEDSRAFEFDDTNIFNLNRFEGSDRVTSGTRFDYGVKASIFGPEIGSAHGFLGQSIQLAGERVGVGHGSDKRFSDVVGRFHAEPNDWLDVFVRFRLDPDALKVVRREVDLHIDRDDYRLRLDYVLLADRLSSSGFGPREQLDMEVALPLDDNWTALGRVIRDFTLKDDPVLRRTLGITYGDECFDFSVEFDRNNIVDENIVPEDRIMFRIKFRNLG